jgi:DNA-binding NarL/FixJ family response regulator
MRPTILVADDHALVLEGFRKLLEHEFDVVATAHDGAQLLEETARLQPDLILVDISMPLLNGIEATRKILAAAPSAKIIIVTQHSDRRYVQAAFSAGARGYVLKHSAAPELVQAIHEVLAGRFYIAAAIEAPRNGRLDPNSNPAEFFASELTPRQREVLQLIAEGRQAKQIAAILKISPKTVEFHKAALMDHLGLRTTAELTRYAIDQGISTV